MRSFKDVTERRGLGILAGILVATILAAVPMRKALAADLGIVAINDTGYTTAGSDAGAFKVVCDSDEYTDEQKAIAGCEEKRSAGGVANFIINIVLGLLEVGAVAAIVYGGFIYTSSRGDPDKVKKGKQIILYAVIGLVIGLLAFAIVNFVLGGIG